MLYGIKTRLVAAVFFLLFFGLTSLLAQVPDSQNLSLDSSQKPATNFISTRPETPSAEITPGDISDLASFKPVDAIDFNNLGVQYAKRKHYTEAITMLRRAIELDPKQRTFIVNLCNIYDLADQPVEALNVLRQAAAFAPFNAVEQIKECELLLFSQYNQEAITCYKTVGKTAQLDDISKVNLGVGLMRLEKWKEADEMLEPVEPTLRHNPRYFNALGMVRYQIKQYKGAVEAFKQATELAPDQMDVRFNLALAQLAIRDKPGALSQYKFLSESAPDLAEKLYRAIYSDKILFVGNK